ncbi:MAG: hypothetical protein QGF09_05825 [Rhodospirillales bacterium]|nr:hypothetical protein [Rhodospirillales bacterium]
MARQKTPAHIRVFCLFHPAHDTDSRGLLWVGMAVRRVEQKAHPVIVFKVTAVERDI